MEEREIKMSSRDRRIRGLCKSSIFWTAWYLCGYRKISMVLHFCVAFWFQKQLKDGHRLIAVLIPRDYFKTSALGVAAVVWFLINDPEKIISYVMHNEKIAKKKMDEVRSAFESKQMARSFPELAVGPQNRGDLIWRQEEFTIPRRNVRGTPSVQCFGITGGDTGSHSDVIIWDDPIKGDSEDAAGQMEAAMSKFKKVVFTRKGPNAVWYILGTLWEGGFYEMILAHKRFKHITLGCYVDDRFWAMINEVKFNIDKFRNSKDGKDYIENNVLKDNWKDLWKSDTPIFPEMDTMESLDEKRELAQEHFVPQMLNIPSSAKDKKFLREDCIRYDPIHNEHGEFDHALVGSVAYPYEFMEVGIMYDPSGGMNRSSDNAGMTCCGWLPRDGLAFELDYWRGKEPPRQQLERLVAMAIKWKFPGKKHVIGVERAALQMFAEEWLRDICKRKGIKLNVQKVPIGNQNKFARATQRLQPFISNRQVLFHPDHTEIVDEIVNLNTSIKMGKLVGESPALADCMVMHTKFWLRRGLKKEPQEEEILTPLDYEDSPRSKILTRYGCESVIS